MDGCCDGSQGSFLWDAGEEQSCICSVTEIFTVSHGLYNIFVMWVTPGVGFILCKVPHPHRQPKSVSPQGTEWPLVWSCCWLAGKQMAPRSFHESRGCVRSSSRIAGEEANGEASLICVVICSSLHLSFSKCRVMQTLSCRCFEVSV